MESVRNMYERKKDITKKAYRELKKKDRVVTAMNTGTRVFKDDRHPDRARIKEIIRRVINERSEQRGCL